MDGLKWMGAAGMAAALLFAGAAAWAGDEVYQQCPNCVARAVAVCRTIPHYPNAQSYEPFDPSFDSISARTRTTDNPAAVVDWFKAHLGPGWTYRQPARDEWPQTPMFWGPGGWSVTIETNFYPTQIIFSCNGG